MNKLSSVWVTGGEFDGLNASARVKTFSWVKILNKSCNKVDVHMLTVSQGLVSSLYVSVSSTLRTTLRSMQLLPFNCLTGRGAPSAESQMFCVRITFVISIMHLMIAVQKCFGKIQTYCCQRYTVYVRSLFREEHHPLLH